MSVPPRSLLTSDRGIDTDENTARTSFRSERDETHPSQSRLQIDPSSRATVPFGLLGPQQHCQCQGRRHEHGVGIDGTTIQHGFDCVSTEMSKFSRSDTELTLITSFFFPYAIFEVPSNIVLKLMRPSIWISILMVTWGIVSSTESVEFY
jgi:hypothetical protein